MPTLNWIGKDKVINHHLDVTYRTLDKRYTYNSDAISENKIIHGDNLEALKSLLPEYEGRIKCIYIDPPYNTGNEGWVYNDSVNDPKIKKWLGEVVGKESEDLTRHDKWLCMMYPRLKLLHRLLADDGAIFISIDDNEQANSKLVCDEIFGRRNLVKSFIWQTSGNTDNQDVITHVHEYLLCYAKDLNHFHVNNVVDPNIPSDSKIYRDYAENSVVKNGYKNPPSIITLPIGFHSEEESLTVPAFDKAEEFCAKAYSLGYITRDLTSEFDAKYPLKLDDLNISGNKLVKSCRVFSGWSNANKLQRFIDNNCEPIIDDDGSTLHFYLTKTGVIYYRREGRTPHYIQTVLHNMGTTEVNKYMLEAMGLKFDYPKPVELITFLLSMIIEDNSIVLDSFAGSGTTAHAVLNLNKDGGNRKFILVEMEEYADSITAERVKRVIDGYGEDKNAVEGTGGDFSYYELGQPMFIGDDYLNEELPLQEIHRYIWYTETACPFDESKKSHPHLLGVNDNSAYYFFYEKDSLTTLNYDFLQTIKEKSGAYVIYADNCVLEKEFLARKNIIFKKIPRDITRF